MYRGREVQTLFIDFQLDDSASKNDRAARVKISEILNGHGGSIQEHGDFLSGQDDSFYKAFGDALASFLPEDKRKKLTVRNRESEIVNWLK